MIITVKYFGPTNTKGSRFRVESEGWGRKWYPYPHEERDAAFQVAADYAASHGYRLVGDRFDPKVGGYIESLGVSVYIAEATEEVSQ